MITGASSGIGAATAKELARLGFDLLLMARRQDRLAQLQLEIAQLAPKVKTIVHQGDVRSRIDVQAMVEQNRSSLTSLTVLVNNAGLAKGVESFQAGNLDDWQEMIDTNVMGLLLLTRLLLPFMIKENRGHIVNLGSVAGRWVYPGGAVYCASKFAVRAISEGLRQDLAGTGIRVSNIEPGMVESEFSVVRLGDQAKANAVYEGMTPLTPEDIAETISWCLSRPAHVNIQELVIYPTDQAAIRQVTRSVL
jgi:NADP-dependent 3-hydroxy acid dehydrogenase YdfG